MTRTWPENWDARKRGDNCPFCTKPADNFFYIGRVSEALLERHPIANGHVVVVFRGRHVADFTGLSPTELSDYAADLQAVGALVERVFRPCHMNYMLLGNIVPHLHVHVVPRYLDDAAPERPLPWTTTALPDTVFAEQLQRLKAEAGHHVKVIGDFVK